MKKSYLLPFILICVLASCKKGNDVSMNPPQNKIETLPGIISGDLILKTNTDYIINGQVFVKNNATLTIPAGITVSMVKNDALENKSVLVITKGSKLFINGTVDKPVVFTSASTTRSPGDWGAIILLGNAPINIPAKTDNIAGLNKTADTEFGGSVPDDNSGSISYLRMEYCGGINPENEDEWAVDKASGLCLGGVGSGTKIDNVMVEHSNDDAFQFLGGTVNVTHLIGYNNGDDDFDFDLGYTGKLQFLISYRAQLTSNHALRANGLESYNDEVPTTNPPLTRPVISNMTIIGPQGNESVKSNLNQGVYIRKGTRFFIQNSVIAEYPQGALMLCPKTKPPVMTDKGSEFRYNLVQSDDANRTFSYDNGSSVNGDPELKVFALNSVNNNKMFQASADLQLTAIYANNPDLTPMSGSEAASGANFEGANYLTFFTPVAYRGAIGQVNWAAASTWAVWK
ncbi:MAG: hypothetical protein ABI760_08290 [Ferruginibacter sp.]